MNKIEHIGIAVQSLNEAIPRFERILGTSCYKTELVESEKVNTAFFKVGPNKIELLEATKSDSPIAKFLQKNGPGFHHVAFEVDDIENEISRLQAAGFELIHQQPKDGADNKRIAFLHPKSSGGLLVELCQEKNA